MTATGTPAAAEAVPARRRPQWVRVTRTMLGLHGVLGAWFWGATVVVLVVATLIVDHFTTVRVSMVQYAHYAMLWFPFSIAVVIAAAALTVYVATGVTRRSFIRGALASSAVVALAYGLVMALLLLLEGVIYDALGWVHGAMGTDDGVVVEGIWESGLHVIWAVGSLMMLAGLVSGLAVGAGYYRFGGLRGTLALPLGLLPVLAAQLLVDLGSAESLGRQAGLGDWVYVLVAALTVALALWFVAVVRRTPIGGVES